MLCGLPSAGSSLRRRCPRCLGSPEKWDYWVRRRPSESRPLPCGKWGTPRVGRPRPCSGPRGLLPIWDTAPSAACCITRFAVSYTCIATSVVWRSGYPYGRQATLGCCRPLGCTRGHDRDKNARTASMIVGHIVFGIALAESDARLSAEEHGRDRGSRSDV